MIHLAVLRHGETTWTAEGRIQGRADIPLSDAGRTKVAAWRLPADLVDLPRRSSPLQRCLETARLLPGTAHGVTIRVSHSLIEMDWGEWEGYSLDELRRRHGTVMQNLENQGLDFRAPGGESPREVQDRLQPWLRRLADEGQDCVVICHKGVMRALYALATGWAMVGKPPQKLKDAMLHRFALDEDGTPHVERLNIALVPGAGEAAP
jgi:probable phosphoglycerate mutase